MGRYLPPLKMLYNSLFCYGHPGEATFSAVLARLARTLCALRLVRPLPARCARLARDEIARKQMRHSMKSDRPRGNAKQTVLYAKRFH